MRVRLDKLDSDLVVMKADIRRVNETGRKTVEQVQTVAVAVDKLVSLVQGLAAARIAKHGRSSQRNVAAPEGSSMAGPSKGKDAADMYMPIAHWGADISVRSFLFSRASHCRGEPYSAQ